MNKKEVRQKFRNEVFTRDNYTCRICGVKGDESTLDAHHIINRNLMPEGGYILGNGITLCKAVCHLKAEKGEISVETLLTLINGRRPAWTRKQS